MSPELLERVLPACMRDVLAETKVEATVRAERLKGTKLFRLNLKSKTLYAMRHASRQDLLWGMLHDNVGRLLTRHVASINILP